jgi:hypothetical protein
MELRGEDRMLACSGAGFAAGGLLMARYRMKASLIDSASTYGLAARAIGLGTLISVSSVGLLIGLTAKALDIHSVKQPMIYTYMYSESAHIARWWT